MRSLFMMACGAVWVCTALAEREPEQYFEIPAQPESPRRQCDEFPHCGGYWVEKVNTKGPESWYYVAALLFPDDLSENDIENFLGAAATDGSSFGAFALATLVVEDGGSDVLQIHETYAGFGVRAAEGSTVAKITGTGLRCLTEPCLSTVVQVVNTGEEAHVSTVVLDSLEEDVVAKAEQLIQCHHSSGFLAATSLQEAPGKQQREATAAVVTGVAFRQGATMRINREEA
jgi:hypothetical protein